MLPKFFFPTNLLEGHIAQCTGLLNLPSLYRNKETGDLYLANKIAYNVSTQSFDVQYTSFSDSIDLHCELYDFESKFEFYKELEEDG